MKAPTPSTASCTQSGQAGQGHKENFDTEWIRMVEWGERGELESPHSVRNGTGLAMGEGAFVP